MSCFYCEKDQRLYDLMAPLAELDWADVYLFRDQKHRGRVVVALKGHCDEIWQLADEQRNGFFADVALAAQAVSNVAHADKINYAIYGDNVSHFHVHVVPKVRDGLQWGGPFTDTLPKVALPEADFKALGLELLAQMDALAAAKDMSAPKHTLQ